MDVTLPNGKVIKGVPDNATKHEIREKAIRNGLASLEDFGEVDYELTESLKSIPESGMQYGRDVFEGLAGLSPWSHDDGFRVPPAIEGVGQLASGLAQNVLPEVYNAQTGFNPQHQEMVGAVGDYYGDRYGGVNEIKRTAMNDPVGLLADASLPLTALLSGGATAATRVPKLASVLRKGSKAAEALDPVGAAQQVSRPLYNRGTNLVMRNVDDLGDKRRIAGKMYDADIPLNESGLDEISARTNAGMRQRDELLGSIDGEYSVGRELFPQDDFLADMFDADSGARGKLTVDEARQRVGSVVQNEAADALSKSPTRDARGLNDIKSRQMKIAEQLRAYEKGDTAVEGLTHRNMGTRLKQRLESLAGDRGDELRLLNEDYADLSAAGRGLGDALGKNRPEFGIDYSVRSAAGASGLGPKQAVGLGVLAANYGGQRAADLALLLKNTKTKQALVSALRQTGRSQQEIDKILAEAEQELE